MNEPLVELIPQTFFTPNEDFWKALREALPDGVKLIDCGAGMGHVTAEARRRGFDMDAVDLCSREGMDPCVRIEDATRIQWGKYLWPLICRPCHNGFAAVIARNALVVHARLLYVGLQKNVRRDLGATPTRLRSNIGEEGENLYLLKQNLFNSFTPKTRRSV